MAPEPRRDRYERHQLVFELGGAALLIAVTRQAELVILAGGILLPAVRATWLGWLGLGPRARPNREAG